MHIAIKNLFVFFISTSLLAFNCFAQDDDAGGLEEIVVTGSRLSNSSPPGISLSLRADYFIKEINIESDSREKEDREKDIRKTLKLLMEKMTASGDYKLVEVRDEALLAVKNTGQVSIINDRRRADTSYISLAIRRPLKKTE